MARYLTIFEVSQKQAYIYGVNKLSQNIKRSAEIAYVTSPEFIKMVLKKAGRSKMYNDTDNLVYSGGGHIITEYDDKDRAKEVSSCVTKYILENYPEMEVFTTTRVYNESFDDLKKGESIHGKNLTLLIQALEVKKAERKSVFSKESFGVEKINSDTLMPEIECEETELPEKYIEKDTLSERYAWSDAFGDLGGSKGDKNYIAVVHIDGNGMGFMVDKAYAATAGMDWNHAKQYIREFSEGTQRDYEAVFRKVCSLVKQRIEDGTLDRLDLKERSIGGVVKKIFPIRKILIEGDDICFVTEGRIGIECAVAFLMELYKTNRFACAGVAIVHQKYPFFKAYDLAEELCTNAKKFAMSSVKVNSEDERIEKGILVSAIDWHIEQGEISGGISDIREKYIAKNDGSHLEIRPYIVAKQDGIILETENRDYAKFRAVIRMLTGDDAFARSKVKGLRQTLKRGCKETELYLLSNNLKDITIRCYQGIYEKTDPNKVMGKGLKGEAYVNIKSPDNKPDEYGNEKYEKHSVLFDSIELMDLFIQLTDEEEA